MASKDVETKVVQVRFDNQKFEKNIKATIKSTEALDKSLQFKGSREGIKELSKSIENLDTSRIAKDVDDIDKQTRSLTISFKELLKIKVLSRIIDSITNSTMNMLKAMTGVGNIKAGWDAYNESLTTTGGILNQVQRDGYGLTDVTDALEKLRWYADETSYSFQTMSDGIRQFTIAGIDLKEATSAVQGVANLAGSAKVFDTFKVQSAMDAISKSMQTGYMDTMKWTTLTNTAGIVTKDFSEKLLEAAAAQGTLIKDLNNQYRTKKSGKLVTPENIRSTLSDRWVTNEVMTRVLGEYNSATEVVKAFTESIDDETEGAFVNATKGLTKLTRSFSSFDEMLEDIRSHPESYDEEVVKLTKDMNANNLTTRQAAKLMKALGYEFDEVSYKAFMSSQETTSFGQAISFVATAIKTSWQGVFQAMFGDVEKSTNLWSDISDKFYGIFVAPFNALEEQFKIWEQFEEGGAEDFRQSILNIIDALGKFSDKIKDTFVRVLGDDLTNVLKSASLWLKNFSEGLLQNETTSKFIETIAIVAANILKIIINIGRLIGQILNVAGTAMTPILEAIVDISYFLANIIEDIVTAITESGALQRIFNLISEIVKTVSVAIRKLITSIKNSGLGSKIGAFLYVVLDGILWAINKVIEGISSVIEWVGSLFGIVSDEAEDANENVNVFADTVDRLRKFFEMLATPFKKAIDYFKKLDFSSGFKSIGEFMLKIKQGLLDKLSSVSKWFKENDWLQDHMETWAEGLKVVWGYIKDFLYTVFKPLADGIRDKDTRKVVEWLLGLIGIIALVVTVHNYMTIARRATQVFAAIADMFWALEERFRSRNFVNLGKALVYASAAIAILIGTIAYIIGFVKENDIGSIIGGLVIIGIAVADLLSIMVVMSAVVSKQKGLIWNSFVLVNFAAAMALMMLAIRKAFDAVSGVDMGNIGKAILVLGAVTLMMATIIASSSIGKWYSHLPLILSFAKILLSMGIMMQMAVKLIRILSPYSSGDVWKAVGILAAITVMFNSIILVSTVAQAIQKGLKISGLNSVTLVFLSLAAILLAFIGIIKLTKGMSVGDILGAGVIFATIAVVVAIASAAALLINKIPTKGIRTAHLKIASVMASIGLSVLAMTLAMRAIAGMDIDTIRTGAFRITLLYLAVGAVAVVLSAIAKIPTKGMVTSEFNVSKEGLVRNKTSGQSSGIGGLIMAITLSTLALTLCMSYIASIPKDEFDLGAKRMQSIILPISIIAAVLLFISHIHIGQSGGKAAIKFAGTTVILLAALIVIGQAVMQVKKMIDEDEAGFKKSVAWLGGIIGGIILFVTVIGLISKFLYGKVLKGDLVKTLITLGIVVGSLYLVGLGLQMLSKIKWQSLVKSIATMGIALASIIAAIAILGLLQKKSSAILEGASTMLIVSTSLLILAGALTLMSTMLNWNNIGPVLIGLAGTLGALIVAVAVLGALGTSGIGKEGALLLIGIAGALLILAAAAYAISLSIGIISEVIHLLSQDFMTFLRYIHDSWSDEDTDKINTLVDSLYRLAGAQLANGLAEFAVGIGKLQNAFGNLMLWFTQKAADNAYNSFITFIDKLSSLDLWAIALHVTALKDAIKDFINSVGDTYDSLLLSGSLNNTTLDQINKIAYAINSIFPKGSATVYMFAAQYIDAIRELIESAHDVTMTITPVFDFSQFDAGMNYIKTNIGGAPTITRGMGSYITALRTQNDTNSVLTDVYRGAILGGPNRSNYEEGGMKVDIIQNVSTDVPSGFFSIDRATRNAISEAARLGVTGMKFIDNVLTKRGR